MAIAGKVAITPGYEWSVDVAYDKLVVVTYGNNVYLSTKPSTGIEPTNEEYWMLLIENVTAEDLAELQTIVESIINGTTPVAKAKDADTVDGFHATDLMSTLKTLKVEGESVVADLFDNAYNNRIVEIHTKADNTSNLPPTLLADDKSGVGFQDGWIHGWMITLSLNNTWSRKIYISLRSNNNYECWEKGSSGSGVWSAWKSYLPLTGGTLGAPYNIALTLKNIASLWSLLKYEDTTGVLGHLGFSEKDKPIFVNADATNYHELLHAGTIGKLREYLNVYANSSNAETYSSFIQNANGTHVRHVTDANNFDEFFIKKGSITYAKMVNGAWSQTDVLHTGNKPTGTYTGNGSATSRTIQTGGIGYAVLIFSSNGFSILTPSGAIARKGEIIETSNSSFLNGVITLNTDDTNYNATGVTYYYQVL